MLFKRFILLIIIFFYAFSCFGQIGGSKTNGLSIEIDYGYGFMMPHHKMIEYFVEDHIQTVDIKFNQATYGEKYWNQLYRYPHYGLGFYRSNLGNDEVYGMANALYAYIKVPFWGNLESSNLSWQIGFGGSYLTKHFDINENPQNLAIGTNLNIYIDLSIQSQIPLSKRINLTNNVRFSHFSNGKVKSPNKGLNIISGSIGLLYHLNEPPGKYHLELPKIENKNEYSIIYAGGIKTKSRYEPGYFYASSFMLNYHHNYSLKRRWSLGADLFYDETKRQYPDKTQNANMVNPNLYQAGLHVGHEMVLGDLAMIINLGGYIYVPVKEDAPIYSRIGLRYRFAEKYIANITLKSHWAIASYIEWGIGYTFK